MPASSPSIEANSGPEKRYLMTRFAVLSICISLFMFVSEAQAGPAMARYLCIIDHPSDAKVDWECSRLRKGETLKSRFGDRMEDVLRFNRIDRRHVYRGIYLKVPKQLDDIKDFTPMPATYPPAEKEAKFILIDLSEQFLGAYEFGHLVFSAPVATGNGSNCTPAGEFRITAADRDHRSSLYFIEKTQKKYPMNYALRFFTNRNGVEFWIHGRDIPGYPASHGCIGMYDEEMQKKYYKNPGNVMLQDAKTLYEWVMSPLTVDGGYHALKDGPKVEIIGQAPMQDACTIEDASPIKSVRGSVRR
jgi:hypothetical protein